VLSFQLNAVIKEVLLIIKTSAKIIFLRKATLIIQIKDIYFLHICAENKLDDTVNL